MIAALLLAIAAPAMVVINEDDVKREEPPPHGGIGMSTTYRISDAAQLRRAMEFGKRILHMGAAIGLHPISHVEVYYVLTGEGEVNSDGDTKSLKQGMSTDLYNGAVVGIRQRGLGPLTSS